MAQASANIDEKYQAYFAGLTELVQFTEKGNMDAYFAQPTQGMQNALGAALGEYAKASGELYHSAFTQSQNDYRFAKWQMAVLALALVIVLVAVWYGIRHILLNPLGRVIAHIRDIGRGDLTKTLTVSGRNEITELATSVDHMQRSLIDTVANVREGADAIYTGTSEIAMGNNDLVPYRTAGVRSGRDGGKHGAAHRDREAECRQRPSGVAACRKRVRHRPARRSGGRRRGENHA